MTILNVKTKDVFQLLLYAEPEKVFILFLPLLILGFAGRVCQPSVYILFCHLYLSGYHTKWECSCGQQTQLWAVLTLKLSAKSEIFPTAYDVHYYIEMQLSTRKE